MHKKVRCASKIVVLLIKPIAFLTCSLPLWLLKFPSHHGESRPRRVTSAEAIIISNRVRNDKKYIDRKDRF